MTFATDIAIEVQDSGGDIFITAEKTRATNDALLHFSRVRPREVTETLYTVASSRLVDISGLIEADLIYGYDKLSFNPVYGVEYKTGQWPRKYRNFKIELDDEFAYIEMDLDDAPGTSDEEVKVRCYKLWTEATIPSGYDDIIIRLASGLMAKYKPLYFLNLLAKEIGDGDSDMLQAINDAYFNTEDAIDDITTAKSYFNTVGVGQPDLEYLRSAASQLQVALARLREGGGYADHNKLRMQTVNLGRMYEAWGNIRVAEVKAEMAHFAKRKEYKRWPTAT